MSRLLDQAITLAWTAFVLTVVGALILIATGCESGDVMLGDIEADRCPLAYCEAWCGSRGAECSEINEDGGFVCVIYSDGPTNVNFGTLEAAEAACAPE